MTSREKNTIETYRAKPPTPTRGTDARMGDEEENGKHKKGRKKVSRQRVKPPTPTREIGDDEHTRKKEDKTK